MNYPAGVFNSADDALNYLASLQSGTAVSADFSRRRS